MKAFSGSGIIFVVCTLSLAAGVHYALGKLSGPILRFMLFSMRAITSLIVAAVAVSIAMRYSFVSDAK